MEKIVRMVAELLIMIIGEVASIKRKEKGNDSNKK